MSSIFFANVDSAMFAKGLSAPQHSTYLVILLDGLDLVGGPPGVAIPGPPVPCSLMLLDLSQTVDKRCLTLPFASESGFYTKQQNIQFTSEKSSFDSCPISSTFSFLEVNLNQIFYNSKIKKESVQNLSKKPNTFFDLLRLSL